MELRRLCKGSASASEDELCDTCVVFDRELREAVYGTEAERALEAFQQDLQRALMQLLRHGEKIPVTAPDGFDRLFAMVKETAERWWPYKRLGVRMGADARTEEQRRERWCVPIEVYELWERVEVTVTVEK